MYQRRSEAQSGHRRVGKFDDLHFLRWNATSGIEISNHVKYIANEYPVTLIFIGVRASQLPILFWPCWSIGRTWSVRLGCSARTSRFRRSRRD